MSVLMEHGNKNYKLLLTFDNYCGILSLTGGITQ